MQSPDISIVVPAYRAAATIARTLLSVLREVPGRNVSVVMDGPDLAAEDAVRSVDPDIRLTILPERSGAPRCRNHGLAMAATEFVMFLDADDYVEDGFLSAAATAGAAADLILGRYALEFPDGRRDLRDPVTTYVPFDDGTVLRRWLMEAYTPPCAVVWRTEFVRALGGWDEALAKNQDGDLAMRALVAGARIAAVPSGLGIYTQADNPNRITRHHDRRTLASQLAVLDKVHLGLGGLSFDPSGELSRAYYHLARLAYSHGVYDIGERAEALARELGLTGQIGSPAHCLLAGLFGLRGKQRLVSLARMRLNG